MVRGVEGLEGLKGLEDDGIVVLTRAKSTTTYRTNSSRRSSTKISFTPAASAFFLAGSSSSPCPRSAVKVTTSQSYSSWSHLRITDVSRPPEYASTTLFTFDLSTDATVVLRPEARARATRAGLLAARGSVGDDERRETGALISDGLAWEHSCRAEAGSSCASLGDDDDRFFADRLVRGALRVVEDPECQQGHALDAGGPGFSVLEAARIFRKCRVLVLRNAMDRGDVEQFRDALADHILALKNGTLSMKGSTTHGEDYFVFPLSNRDGSTCR